MDYWNSQLKYFSIKFRLYNIRVLFVSLWEFRNKFCSFIIERDYYEKINF